MTLPLCTRRQVDASTIASWAFVGDNGGMKRTSAIKEKTGAPPAIFLTALKVKTPFELVITKTRDERKSHALLTTDEIGKRVWLDLMELADRVLTDRALDDLEAAETLAVMAKCATMLLEDLASLKGQVPGKLISFAAQKMDSWPVLLRRGAKNGKPCLDGAKKAKSYLNDIKQGKQAASVPTLKHFHDEGANIFKRAAELLLFKLVKWRERGAWRGKITDWVKELYALKLPMTTDNVDAWWSVAQQWMVEQWVTNRKNFHPLEKHLQLDNKYYKTSLVRRRVIDDSLKKAFKALAVPAEK